ncbi:hypothetical protein [Salinisphaera sp. Q1T1-3]|uniref:hypothetical protein n=1 Tax=Salinisphaera sp. Q1T1-3 TaxID=2321229 RepID=UPI00268C619F|nr:hypothetical protein [Salinisphaera sp. Q1T1-3]
MVSRASTDSIWTHLSEWEARAPSGAIYAFVDKRFARALEDPIALPRLSEGLYADAVCVPRADLKHKPDLCPHLVRINTADQPLRRCEDIIRRLVDNLSAPVSIHGNYVAAFLQSNAPAQALAQSLARRLVQRDAQGKQRVTALYEPLRLALYLDDTEDPARRDAWLGEIDAWLTVNGGGELLAWHSARDRSAHAKRLPYTRGDAVHQARIPEMRRLLIAMRKAGIAAPARPEITLSNYLGEAEAHGLNDPEDRIFYVLNSLSFGPGWDAPGAIRSAIASAARNEQRLAKALELLSAQHQTRVAQSGGADPIHRKGAFA